MGHPLDHEEVEAHRWGDLAHLDHDHQIDAEPQPGAGQVEFRGNQGRSENLPDSGLCAKLLSKNHAASGTMGSLRALAAP